MGERTEQSVNRSRKVVGEINNIFQATLASSDDFPLKHSYILDSGSSLHVSHDLKRFSDFRKVPIGHHAVCGNGSVTIQGYGKAIIDLTNPKRRVRSLKLYNLAYCSDFPMNLISLRLLEARGIDWNHRSGQLMFHGDSDILGSTRRTHGQYILEHCQAETYTTFAAITTNQNRYSNRSRKQRQPA